MAAKKKSKASANMIRRSRQTDGVEKITGKRHDRFTILSDLGIGPSVPLRKGSNLKRYLKHKDEERDRKRRSRRPPIPDKVLRGSVKKKKTKPAPKRGPKK